MNGKGIYTKCCKAMLDAGITDPESDEGILFCTGTRDGTVESKCPYDYCVVVEHHLTTARIGADKRAILAKSFREHGVSVEDIALILERDTNTIRGYLRRL